MGAGDACGMLCGLTVFLEEFLLWWIGGHGCWCVCVYVLEESRGARVGVGRKSCVCVYGWRGRFENEVGEVCGIVMMAEAAIQEH